MPKLTEPAYSNHHRPNRKPLRSLKELAESFGVSSTRLAGLLGAHNGPKHKLQNKSPRVTWFDPDEVRAWWKSLPDEVRSGSNSGSQG